jgi:hypothetical protein
MAGEYKRMPLKCRTTPPHPYTHNTFTNVSVAYPDLKMIKPKQCKNVLKN